jgi:hypothetical protein
MINEIEINGVIYVPKGTDAPKMCADGYCIIRTHTAGVFAGCLEDWDGGLIGVATNARRLWYWKGAASLSQLAMEGVKYPAECKFSVPVPRVSLTEIIEVIPCTQAAFDSIQGVQEWRV